MSDIQMERRRKMFNRAKPFIAVIFLQFGLSGMDILSKVALNKGMSNYVLVVYRHAVATIVIAPFAFILDKKVRPRMTLSIFAKLLLLGLLEPVIDQNLYFMGMKYTTATFAAAMYNVLPAITFVMAYIFRLEKVKITSIRSQAKIAGTIITVAGAMVMTVMKGPVIKLFWQEGRIHHDALATGGINLQKPIMGAIMITIGCFSCASFMILQAVTLRTYPAELSLTAWICLLGTLEGGIVALIMEKGKTNIWAINWDTKLLAAVYSGIVCSGLAYYIQGAIMKERGPVFVSAFSPLSMIIVAIMSSFILAEQLFMGRVLGAIVIVAGLYLVVWGKSKDYESPLPSLDEKTAPAKQMMDERDGEENCDHQIININASSERVAIGEKQTHVKGNQTATELSSLQKGSKISTHPS